MQWQAFDMFSPICGAYRGEVMMARLMAQNVNLRLRPGKTPVQVRDMLPQWGPPEPKPPQRSTDLWAMWRDWAILAGATPKEQ